MASGYLELIVIVVVGVGAYVVTKIRSIHVEFEDKDETDDK